MKIYRNQNVYDAAMDRIRFLYDEFPEVICCSSGGKDSTVCFHLCLQVAKEMGRLPLRVMWIDQEAEWQGTVDYMTEIMTRDDVIPMWYQMPMVITNNASSFERYNYCWKPEDEAIWVHPQHPISIKENRFGEVRFHKLFDAILKGEFPDTKACFVGGVRTQEAPKRFLALTDTAFYLGYTWGKIISSKRGHYTAYPIYDWEVKDVWKAIHDNGWPYNRVYDEMYRYGHNPYGMRISNLHHETSIQDLMLVQEIEPETWNRVAAWIGGANTIKQLKTRAFACPSQLPFMFDTWESYAEHLIDNIVQDEKNRQTLRKKLAGLLKVYIDPDVRNSLMHVVINTVLSSDWDFTKLKNFQTNPSVYSYRMWRLGRPPHQSWLKTKYIPEEARPMIEQTLKGKAYE